jgi:putative membrane protein
MSRMLLGVALGALCLGLATAREDEPGKGDTDATFVFKASAGGLAEVNLSTLATKQASDPAVKRFAQKMVDDHTKANKELLERANKARLRVAPRMDEEHQKLAGKLATLSGAAFDREYMAAQVKDHEETVALFEKQASSGKNEDLKSWAAKTLPDLREHLKMAKDINGKLKTP